MIGPSFRAFPEHARGPREVLPYCLYQQNSHEYSFEDLQISFHFEDNSADVESVDSEGQLVLCGKNLWEDTHKAGSLCICVAISPAGVYTSLNSKSRNWRFLKVRIS